MVEVKFNAQGYLKFQVNVGLRSLLWLVLRLMTGLSLRFRFSFRFRFGLRLWLGYGFGVSFSLSLV